MEALVDRARELAAGPRRMLGIAGPPAAGKTTLGRYIAAQVGGGAMGVPMDGFHRADVEPWRQIRPLLDECWWVSMDDATRLKRLIDRHVEFGKSREFAESWVARSDEANARTIAEDWRRADRVIRLR